MLSFTWVDAAGKVHVSARDSPEGRALSGGVGLIGIITGACALCVLRVFSKLLCGGGARQRGPGALRCRGPDRCQPGACVRLCVLVRYPLRACVCKSGGTRSVQLVSIAGAGHTLSPPLPSHAAEVTLQMTPPSLTKAISRVFLNDANLAADIDTYLKVGGVCLCNCFIK